MHIAANMHTAIRTADLARIVGVSSCRIKCVFKDSFGFTPHQYPIRRRVARAQSLLLTSQDSLSPTRRGQVASDEVPGSQGIYPCSEDDWSRDFEE
jgi:AraC-like DNA-binding protein